MVATIMLIETGPGRDSDCTALLAKVKDAPVKNTDAPGQVKPIKQPRVVVPKTAEPTPTK